MDCQNFPGFWGCTFVENWFLALQGKIINHIGDVNSCVRITNEIPKN